MSLEGYLAGFLGPRQSRGEPQPSRKRAELAERARALGLRVRRSKGGWQVGNAWTSNLSGVEDLLADLEQERRRDDHRSQPDDP